ncbi:MAG: hypothetical protein ABIJ47_14380 [Candidatus Bathyarchaeota archaeon]
MTGKRYRLSEKELDVVLVGLILLVDQTEDFNLSDDSLELAKRLVQSRQGRPGGRWSDAADRLWERASRRAQALGKLKVST